MSTTQNTSKPAGSRPQNKSASRGSMLLFVALQLVTLFILLSPIVSYAAPLDREKMSSVMSIINMYLMGEQDLDIELELNELSPNTFNVINGNPLSVTFDSYAADLEFCFVLTPTRSIPAGGVVIEINDSSFNVTGGENCFTVPQSAQTSNNLVKLIVTTPGLGISVSILGLQRLNQSQLTLPRLNRSQWDSAAVRKVLKVFAFGGHATNRQINFWANMRPQDAIREMLNFSEHNLKLSPLAIGEKYTDSAFDHGTLTAWQNFISNESSNIPIPSDRRDQYGLSGYNFDDAYNRMITVRGLNPFRQRIGFWETNYHLAVNLDAGVSRRQIAEYYDLIMEAHEAGIPYKDVMGIAAKSAAIAMQYGHRRNKWDESDQECECNEDFAREIHQLFYGIFGLDDPDHETVTIPETAKMLTGMPVPYINGFGRDIKVDFAEGLADEDHHLNPVTILGRSISGADPRAKIDNLMPISMQHPESLQNLPIMIISVLADDNLSEATKAQLRAAWASMGINRNLLAFIHAYATSEHFHSPNQIKYFTSHERALYIANKYNLDNLEAYFGGGSYNGGRAGTSVGGVISGDFAGDFFKPLNNVFGGQTSAAASDSAVAFEKNYNRLTDDERRLRESVLCDTCDLGQPWSKKWETVLPKRADGQFYVADVARWLWNHAVGDMSSYTDLEKAHLYSLLGAARIDPGSSSDGDSAFDFNLVMCVIADYQSKENTSDAPILEILEGRSWDDYCRSDDDLSQFDIAYTGAQIANNPMIQSVLNQLGNQTLPLNATTGANDGKNLRRHARERINSALGFIFTTPFIFAEGQ